MLNLVDDLPPAKWRRTADGYLVAMPRVARTGIQLYSGKEVGKPEMEVVRVFRPESEVFSKKTRDSFAHRPITNDHPPELVTADNWAKYAKGVSGEGVLRDGEFARVPMLLMDGPTIKDVEEGKRGLSAGYTCDLKWEAGKYRGEDYDAVQTDIGNNHIAVCKKGRGGEQLRFGDSEDTFDVDPEVLGVSMKKAVADLGDADRPRTCPHCGHTVPAGKTHCPECNYEMADAVVVKDGDVRMKTMTIDGVSCEMPPMTAQIVERALAAKDAQIAQLTKDGEGYKAEEEKKKKKMEEDSATIAAKDVKIAELEKQVKDSAVTPAQLDALAMDRVAVITKGRAVLGDKIKIDGQTNLDIRKQVVQARLGDVAKDYSEHQFVAAFDAITVDANAPAPGPNNALADAFRPNPQNTGDADERLKKAYDSHAKRLEAAWNTKSAAA